jgi:hypothetical protein
MLRSLFSSFLFLLYLLSLVQSECALQDLKIDAALGKDLDQAIDHAVNTLDKSEYIDEISSITKEDIAKGFSKREKLSMKLLKKHSKKRASKSYFVSAVLLKTVSTEQATNITQVTHALISRP